MGLLRLLLIPDNQSRRVTLYCLSVAMCACYVCIGCWTIWWTCKGLDGGQHYSKHIFPPVIWLYFVIWPAVPAAWFLLHQIAQKIQQVTLSTVTKVQSTWSWSLCTDNTATHAKKVETENFWHLRCGAVSVVRTYWLNSCTCQKWKQGNWHNDTSGPPTNAVVYQLCHQSTFANCMFSCCSHSTHAQRDGIFKSLAIVVSTSGRALFIWP